MQLSGTLSVGCTGSLLAIRSVSDDGLRSMRGWNWRVTVQVSGRWLPASVAESEERLIAPCVLLLMLAILNCVPVARVIPF